LRRRASGRGHRAAGIFAAARAGSLRLVPVAGLGPRASSPGLAVAPGAAFAWRQPGVYPCFRGLEILGARGPIALRIPLSLCCPRRGGALACSILILIGYTYIVTWLTMFCGRFWRVFRRGALFFCFFCNPLYFRGLACSTWNTLVDIVGRLWYTCCVVGGVDSFGFLLAGGGRWP